jgi:hypothetical protein
MIKSMTGYGRGECQVEHKRFEAEIRSFNHRYLDVSIRLPRKALVSNIITGEQMGEADAIRTSITTGAALLFERAVTVSGFHRALGLLTEYVKTTKRNGKPLAEDPLIRRKLADMETTAGKENIFS